MEMIGCIGICLVVNIFGNEFLRNILKESSENMFDCKYVSSRVLATNFNIWNGNSSICAMQYK